MQVAKHHSIKLCVHVHLSTVYCQRMYIVSLLCHMLCMPVVSLPEYDL